MGARRAWVEPVAVTVVAAGAYVLVLLVTPDPGIQHSSALNAALDARWLMAGIRLLVAVGLVYLLASIVVRVRHGQWIRSAGTVDTGPSAAQAITEDRAALREQLRIARETIADLTSKLDDRLPARDQTVAIMEPTRAGTGQADPDGESGDR